MFAIYSLIARIVMVVSLTVCFGIKKSLSKMESVTQSENEVAEDHKDERFFSTACSNFSQCCLRVH